MLVEVTGEKLVGGLFAPPILNRVKECWHLGKIHNVRWMLFIKSVSSILIQKSVNKMLGKENLLCVSNYTYRVFKDLF